MALNAISPSSSLSDICSTQSLILCIRVICMLVLPPQLLYAARVHQGDATNPGVQSNFWAASQLVSTRSSARHEKEKKSPRTRGLPSPDCGLVLCFDHQLLRLFLTTRLVASTTTRDADDTLLSNHDHRCSIDRDQLDNSCWTRKHTVMISSTYCDVWMNLMKASFLSSRIEPRRTAPWYFMP